MIPDEFLASLGRFGIHLGLERIEQLLADLGDPHRQVPTIHIAGTNGKGSVCAYVSSILQAAGYRVGRYISPHLVDWRERICINSAWISEADLLTALIQVKQVMLAEQMPTQFEVITAAAWWYFANQKVDVAVIETGLGGRLDATNVCGHPLVSVITSISMEHWQRLGSTLGAIASEKAGIIKSSCAVVAGELPPEARAVVQAKAIACNAPIHWSKAAVKTDFGAIYQNIEYPLPLLGEHQLINSAISIDTIRALQSQGWQIGEDAIVKGMASTQWQGRLQWIEYELNGQKHQLLIDGAHNVAAAKYLRTFVDRSFPSQRKRWIVGMLDTKDHAGILQALLSPQDLLFTVPVPAHQTADPQMLASLGDRLLESKSHSYTSLQLGLDAAFTQDYDPSDLVVLCGSLYLVGEFLKAFGSIE